MPRILQAEKITEAVSTKFLELEGISSINVIQIVEGKIFQDRSTANY